MDIYDLVYNLLVYIIYPLCLIVVGNEIYRLIFLRFILDEDDEDEEYNEFHEPSIEMCSRCKNPNCDHRLADYVED